MGGQDEEEAEEEEKDGEKEEEDDDRLRPLPRAPLVPLATSCVPHSSHTLAVGSSRALPASASADIQTVASTPRKLRRQP